MDKIQRNWELYEDYAGITAEDMFAAQRKAMFELLRDVTLYAKSHPNCHVKNIRFDPISMFGSVGVEMIDLPNEENK